MVYRTGPGIHCYLKHRLECMKGKMVINIFSNDEHFKAYEFRNWKPRRFLGRTHFCITKLRPW